MKKTHRYVLFVFFLVLIGCVIYFGNNPIYFSKSVIVRKTDHFLQLSQLDSSKAIDIHPIISAIPYQDDFSYVVDPGAKYETSIIQGHGDCSNLSFGLSYLLDKEGHDFSIIHFFRIDGDFLQDGHVALSTTYEFNGKKQTGIVDVLEGGLPTKHNGFVTISDLNQIGEESYSITSLNDLRDNSSNYYNSNYLKNAVIGISTSDDVNAYFKFLNISYVPLDNDRIEKYFFDLAAIIFGYYPNIYISQDDYEKIFSDHYLIVFFAHFFLWSVRLSPLLAIIFFLENRRSK